MEAVLSPSSSLLTRNVSLNSKKNYTVRTLDAKEHSRYIRRLKEELATVSSDCVMAVFKGQKRPKLQSKNKDCFRF